jgi:hydrogenase maturation protease
MLVSYAPREVAGTVRQAESTGTAPCPGRTLFVGIGSPHGDDQVGWHVALRVAATIDHPQLVVRRAQVPIELLDWLEGSQQLVVCDACRAGGTPGQVRRWNWPADEMLPASWSGTHGLRLPDVLLLAERLGQLPPRVSVWGVEIRDVQPGTEMSNNIQRAVARAARRIARELRRRLSA